MRPVDDVLAFAARALDAGDVLEALKRVALRTDAPALALRGVALARLGKFERARELLRTAAHAFASSSPLRKARCLLADAEVALACRDLRGVEDALASAATTLAAHGDAANALHAECLRARSLLLRGLTGEAEAVLAKLALSGAPAMLRAEVALSWAELYLRVPNVRSARSAIARAESAAKQSQIPALRHEVALAKARLSAPAARIQGGEIQTLAQLEALLGKSQTLLVDARDHAVRSSRTRLSLARRPVLFSLVRTLAAAWPNGATRAELILHAFSVAHPNQSHRARLRVEIARLRRALRAFATVSATPDGFRLDAPTAKQVVVLTHLVEDEHSAVLLLLADGQGWSSSALAMALGSSQRSVQRALLTLEQGSKIVGRGKARSKRWLLAPNGEFATRMLLPSALEMS